MKKFGKAEFHYSLIGGFVMNIEEFEKEGRNILDFWIEKGFQKNSPLFHFFLDGENNPKAPEGTGAFLITSRALWAFSAGYEIYGDEKYLHAAKRCFEGYPLFFDGKKPGYLRYLKVSNEMFESGKKIYDHAFGVYGLAKYYQVTKDEKALKMAHELFDIIEERSYDEAFGGYYDSFDENWEYVPNNRHPDGAVKNMNCMLHVLEAYTLLYVVSKNERVLEAIKKLTRLTLDKIFNKEKDHLNMFFDRELNSLSDEITCGHDVETSWLLWQTAEALGMDTLKEEIKDVCIRLVKASVKDGYNEEMGEMTDGWERPTLWWWEQAEAVVGFYNMYQLTNDKKYISYSEKVWEHIKKYFIAPNGEWYTALKKGTGQVTSKEKISPFRCPYHNFRMCYEMMRRIK